MNTNGLYTKNVLLPSMVVFLIMVFLTFIINSDFKSEWMTKSSAIAIDIIFSAIVIVLHCAVALPFLALDSNFFKKYSGFKVLLFLPTWIFSVILFIQLIGSSAEELTVCLLLTMPFLVMSFRSFIQIRKESNLTGVQQV